MLVCYATSPMDSPVSVRKMKRQRNVRKIKRERKVERLLLLGRWYDCLVGLGPRPTWPKWPRKDLESLARVFCEEQSAGQKVRKKQCKHLYLLSRLSTKLATWTSVEHRLSWYFAGISGTWKCRQHHMRPNMIRYPYRRYPACDYMASACRSDGRSSNPWKIQGFVRADFHPR